MDAKHVTQNLSQDITILFQHNLSLQKSPKLIEEILRSHGITEISHLTRLEVTDLMVFDIPHNDAALLLQFAKEYTNSADSSQNYTVNISQWLQENNLKQYETKFLTLSPKMLPFIRRSDLLNFLSISPLDCSRVWEALQRLPRTFPPPFEPMDHSCELIRTTLQSPVTIEVNEYNFVEFIKRADTTKNSIKVSFVGDTGVGKSLILSQLLTFDDRIRYGRGPLIASSGQLGATTGNVCLYYTWTKDMKHKWMLLDFEGVYGSTPLRLQNMWDQAKESATPQIKNQLLQIQKERENVVTTIFPQLAYLISNIVILVDRQLPFHTSYIEKLEKFAEASIRNSGTGEKPFLIIIQNFADPDNEKNENAYNIDQSTADFLQCIKSQPKMQSLLQHYRRVCFMRLPSWITHPILYDKQIYLLHNQIASYAEILRNESLFGKNYWNDHFWFTYVKSLCAEFKRTFQQLNIPKLLTNVISRRESPLQRILNFWSVIWMPPIVGSRTTKQILSEYWRSCFDIVLERFAALLFEELQPQLQSSLDLEKLTIKNYVTQSVKEFFDEIWNYSPCLFQFPNGRVCGIAKMLHTTGHYGQNEGHHEGPQIPSDGPKIVYHHMQNLFGLSTVAKVERNLDLFFRGLQKQSLKERQQNQSRSIPFCMSCLNNFRKERQYYLMTCSHVICETCAVRKDLLCPFHSQRIPFVDFRERIPGHAGVRVLSIDGGGLRGIVPIRILSEIEALTGYKIHQLFDLIVGSGIGGVVALAVGIKRDFAKSYSPFFFDCPQKIFKLDFWKKLGIWLKSTYNDKPVIQALKELFGENLSLSRCSLPNNCLVVVTAYRKGAVSTLPVFITNYVHGEGLEEIKELSGSRLVYNCQVWEAGKVALSTPPFFDPWTIGEEEYLDGSVVANNPSVYALREAVSLWKKPIDFLVSIGTGFSTDSSNTRGDTRINWQHRTINLVTETENAVTQTALLCRQNNIKFFRLNPKFKVNIVTDLTTQADLSKLALKTDKYLQNKAQEMKAYCRQLVASLLYVAEINFPREKKEEPVTIVIKSRVPNLIVSSALGGTWRLECSTIKGDMKRSIIFDETKKQQIIARIFIFPLSPECLMRIEMLIVDEGYPISGGDCIKIVTSYNS